MHLHVLRAHKDEERVTHSPAELSPCPNCGADMRGKEE